MSGFTSPEPVAYVHEQTYCNSPCANAWCERRLTDSVMAAARAHMERVGAGVLRISVTDLRCPLFVRDPAPGALLRAAVHASMEEAEMFGDMSAAEREQAIDFLNLLPTPIIGAIGRAFLNATKEMK